MQLKGAPVLLQTCCLRCSEARQGVKTSEGLTPYPPASLQATHTHISAVCRRQISIDTGYTVHVVAHASTDPVRMSLTLGWNAAASVSHALVVPCM